jgi:hypothetical protein
LRASPRTNVSGTLFAASIVSFAPLADTFVMTHGAITDPCISWIIPLQLTSCRGARRFSANEAGRSITNAE